MRAADGVYLTLINKEYGPAARAADVDVATRPGTEARVIRLATADGDIARTTGVTLGGGTIKENGTWDGAWTACPPTDNTGRLVIRVPAASAILVRLPLP